MCFASQRERLTKRFSLRSRQKSSVHGNDCSVSAQPSLHPWVKVYGPDGTIEKPRRRTAYDSGNVALMVPGPLYLGYAR